MSTPTPRASFQLGACDVSLAKRGGTHVLTIAGIDDATAKRLGWLLLTDDVVLSVPDDSRVEEWESALQSRLDRDEAAP